MRRGESIFELDLNSHEEVERGFELEGSNLSGVSARCSWMEQDPSHADMHLKEKSDCDNTHPQDTLRLNPTLPKSIQNANFEQNRSSSTNFKMDEIRNSSGVLESTELLHIKKLDGVHLVFNLEAGSLLPLAIRYIMLIMIAL